MKKLIFALIVVAAVFVVAMPVAAQGPNPYLPSTLWYNRTAEMSATWAGDPFGGNARLVSSVRYIPDGKGGVATKVEGSGAASPFQGIVAKFGIQPYGPQAILPGGIPSTMSGDGSGPRKAIYIGGVWADESAVNPACKRSWDVDENLNPVYDCRYPNETAYELPACATVKVPAGTAKWFKLDTWNKDAKGRALNTQIWLDDELDGATKPSGSAVFGAANKYYIGTQSFDGWSLNYAGNDGSQEKTNVEGYIMAVYSPDFLQPNYAFPAPNAWIFTVDVSSSGGLRRSCTAAAYAGQACVPSSKGGQSLPGGVSTGVVGYYNFKQDASGNFQVFDPASGFNEYVGTASNAVKGFGVYNKHQPSHLLWYETKVDGFVFVAVANQMIWDGTATVCSYRSLLEPRATK